MYVHIIGRYITYVGTYYSWYTMYVGIYYRQVLIIGRQFVEAGFCEFEPL